MHTFHRYSTRLFNAHGPLRLDFSPISAKQNEVGYEQLAENTSQAAESSAAALCRAQPPQAALSASQYEFVCRRRANYARSRLQKLVGKARKGFFDSLKPLPGRQGLGMD